MKLEKLVLPALAFAAGAGGLTRVSCLQQDHSSRLITNRVSSIAEVVNSPSGVDWLLNSTSYNNNNNNNKTNIYTNNSNNQSATSESPKSIDRASKPKVADRVSSKDIRSIDAREFDLATSSIGFTDHYEPDSRTARDRQDRFQSSGLAVNRDIQVQSNSIYPRVEASKKFAKSDQFINSTNIESAPGSASRTFIGRHHHYHYGRTSNGLESPHTLLATDGTRLIGGSRKPMMISKSPEGYYILNNITLKSCRDVLKPQGVDRCTLTDYIEDCVTEEGSIDYVAFFFCAFSPDKMPIALAISIIWLLMLIVATGVTATDFLCPALFMISKTLGLSQNIAGVTFLAFGNMAADIFASINGIRLGKPDLVISVICGSGTVITTIIIGSVFFVKQFNLDKMIFIRDIVFYIAAVLLIMYIFMVPGRIRLQDSISLVGLYLVYVIVVMISKYFSNDKPLEGLHGKSDKDEEGIEFEGVHVDDDPNASMVVMRRFLFLNEDSPQFKPPSFKLDKSDNISTQALNPSILDTGNTLTTRTAKSARRVTLFEENLFSGVDQLSPDSCYQNHQGPRRSRSQSIMSISKHQLVNLRRASRDIRRQSMDFLVAVSPIDPDVWRQRNWGGRTMELVKAPIRLFLLITTPMADIDGKEEWNKPLSVLHCITGPIFVSYAFGFGSTYLGPLSVPVWLFLIMAPMSTIIIFTSSSETPPFYYNAYSSYLGFIVAITWIYTISSEVINLLRAMGIAFDLSSEIMGLTVLAWGNCMLDFITNVSIARKGLPKMAVAACYGGPLMSHLLGIGLPSLIILLLKPDHPLKLGSSPLLYLMFTFLLVGLISTLLVVVVMKFRTTRNLGICLIVLYLLMAISAWLLELKMISLPFLLP